MPERGNATGNRLLSLGAKHIGEKYFLGALAPKNNPRWIGPWDCAEFASWLVYQVSGILYGCNRRTGDPATADAYTGFWASDVNRIGKKIPFEQAVRTPGAAVLRIPQPGAMGHIVISDGRGGTVEARSKKFGVVSSTLDDRRWDYGILVPGIEYTEGSTVEVAQSSTPVYRLKRPLMEDKTVREIQRALKKAGFHPGRIDGAFGSLTYAAVLAFQLTAGLVTDGEVGPQTAKALGVSLR